MKTFLLPLLLFLGPQITYWEITDRFILADVHGRATRSLWVKAKANGGTTICARAVEGTIDVRTSCHPVTRYTYIFDLGKLVAGEYVVRIDLLDGNETLLHSVNAGTVEIQ